MRLKSTSAEKRRRQDIRAIIGLGLVVCIALVGWGIDSLSAKCFGGLQACTGLLLIMMLRYIYRLLSAFRFDALSVANAAGYSLAFVAVVIKLFPSTVWEWLIVLLCLIATVVGLQKCRFTQFFMLITLMIAGSILL